MTAIFVTHATAMNARPGGLQVCTREYLETLRAAGLDVAVHIIEHDARLKTRALRRLLPMPYPDQWRPSAVDEIVGAVERARAQFVCLNLVNLAPLAAALGPRLRRGRNRVQEVDAFETVRQQHDLGAAPQPRAERG